MEKFKPDSKNRFRIKPFYLIISAVLFLLLMSILSSWQNLSERLNLIKTAKLKLIEESQKKEMLKRELAKVQSRDYIEKQAREKLNMAKEGELVILLPTPVILASPTPVPIDNSSNWQKWVRLFL